MPAIPVPFYTLSLLLMLLAKVWLQRPSGYRTLATFITGCALLVLMTALRWQFDALILRHLQSMLAIALPPLAWRCFARVTDQSHTSERLASLLPPVIALVLNLIAPISTDFVLMLLYIGYGGALIWTAYRGADTFVLARLTDARSTSVMAFLAGAFLCFSGLTDVAIMLDYAWYDGLQAPRLVALSQAILLPFICLAILYSGKKIPAADETPLIPPADVQSVEVDSDLAALCEKLERRLTEQQLFLNSDLTLDLLARKWVIPARQISRAVNAVRGCNVSQWINGFRIHYAQHLLLTTDAPVTSIMLEAGFATKSNFNREFVRINGVSPTEFRRAAGNPAPVAEKP
ncbi:helix-turn-helix domain-containing protein [Kosakonia cowanii]|uniref:helix-turn-helix domain-containing protein n=1 Tax=Kosakonia cowanii TaxID=208223 RepID=UPI002731962C|nr:AraC family transcriptional regulator [Kosakonia cowanii]WKW42203.1 AraC family transcriptional regulator [Kosakonia cowanii]